MKTVKARPKRPPLLNDFEAVAKRLECDMDDKRFREKLGKIARAKPPAIKNRLRTK